jgi:A/G-specific adenine glycosylase
MELGALVCTPRNPQCPICPVKKLCVAFQDNRVEELPNLGKREKTTARRFVAFVVERDGKCLVRQRPAGVVNAHLWEFPNDEHNGFKSTAREMFMCEFGFVPPELSPLLTVKHSITRYRITLEAFAISMKRLPPKSSGFWKTPAQMRRLAFTAAHKKLATLAVNRILSGR